MKCMTPFNIINGFRAIGLYPLNPSVIADTGFSPSLTTNRPFVTKTVQDNANIDKPVKLPSQFEHGKDSDAIETINKSRFYIFLRTVVNASTLFKLKVSKSQNGKSVNYKEYLRQTKNSKSENKTK